MKKYMALLLAMVLCLSLLACGGSNNTSGNEDPKQGDQQQEQQEDVVETTQGEERDEYGVLVLSKEEALPYVTKVTLTVDNWQDYFANQTETYHVKTVNDFGDVTLDRDFMYFWFGLAAEGHDVVQIKDVAFKFNRYIDYYAKGDGGDGIEDYECWDRVINEDGTAKMARYLMGTEPQESDWDEIDPPAEGYYMAKPVSKDENKKHYFDCLDVTGEIYLLDLPDEMWTKFEDISEFGRWDIFPESVFRRESTEVEVVRIGDEYFCRYTDDAKNVSTILEP